MRSYRACGTAWRGRSQLGTAHAATVVTGLRMRAFASRVQAPPMVYIKGEEMTKYVMSLIIKDWVEPHIDTSQWEVYDLSCKARDESKDQVLKDAVEAGARIGAIFKEPTITPTAVQQKELGLKNSFGSPNGAMRRGWNGITISRDTIHMDGVKFGYKNPVYFERHAVGGEYGAGWKQIGKGRLLTTFIPDDNSAPVVVDARTLTDDVNVAVVYHNPYDNVTALADIFFERCLNDGIVPYVVTKKTVFKWQEKFWEMMKDRFDEKWKVKYQEKGLGSGELEHLISDAATMQIIRWTDGGFGMAAHNYDGDMLTDEISQVHRSPGFITSNLMGVRDDGALIKEFEASHGTVADQWHAHLAGKETSTNPLGMVEALIAAMDHATTLAPSADSEAVLRFTASLRQSVYHTFQSGEGTRDLNGPSGNTTEAFVAAVGSRLSTLLAGKELSAIGPKEQEPALVRNVDDSAMKAMKAMFEDYDTNGDGKIDFEEFKRMIVKLGVAPVSKQKPM